MDEREPVPAVYQSYDELNLKPDPTPSVETPRLWNWDVAEAFIGSGADRMTRYKEFQVSPQGEWVDLDIDREDPQGQAGMKWNSGYTREGPRRSPSQDLVRRDAHSVCRDRYAPASKGKGAAHRPVSDRRRRSIQAVLCLAADRPDVVSRAAGVWHAAAEIADIGLRRYNQGLISHRWLAEGKLTALPVTTDGATFSAGTPHALFDVEVPEPNPPFPTDYAVTADGQRFLVNTVVDQPTRPALTVILNWTAGLQK